MPEDNTPLSVDAAIDLLSSAPKLVEQPEAEATPEPEIQASPTEADAPSEEEIPGDEGETETQTEAEAVDAPTWWDAEDKAAWATLTPEWQARFAKQEEKREAVLTKAKGETQAERDAAAQDRQQAQAVLKALDDNVPQWVDTFKSRWANVDWDTWAARLPETGAADMAEYTRARAQFEKEQRQLGTALHMQQQAQADSQRQYEATLAQDRSKRLPDLAPDLIDEKEGVKRQTDLSQYLLKGGALPDRVRQMDAYEMSIAWKAFKYDQAQASFAARPKAPPLRAGGLAPTSAPARPSQTRSVENITARLEKSGSVDDAVALFQARRKA